MLVIPQKYTVAGIVGKMKTDHTAFMVLALQLDDVYRESILGFASKKALAGEHIALVPPTLVST